LRIYLRSYLESGQHASANELRHSRLQLPFGIRMRWLCHAQAAISTIARRESHWQSRVL